MNRRIALRSAATNARRRAQMADAAEALRKRRAEMPIRLERELVTDRLVATYSDGSPVPDDAPRLEQMRRKMRGAW